MACHGKEAMRLVFIKDGVFAEFQARMSRWHAVQAAAMAVMGIAVLGSVQGTLRPEHLAMTSAVVAALLLTAWSQLSRYERELARNLRALLDEIRTLKSAEVP